MLEFKHGDIGRYKVFCQLLSKFSILLLYLVMHYICRKPSCSMSSDASNQSTLDMLEKLLLMSKHCGLRRYCLTRRLLKCMYSEVLYKNRPLIEAVTFTNKLCIPAALK